MFDRPIGQNQGVQFPIARAYAELEAADMICRRAAALFDAGQRCGADANMAKLLASEATWHAAEATLADLRRLRLRHGIRHRAQMARDAALPDRADLDQPDPRLCRPARAGDAADLLRGGIDWHLRHLPDRLIKLGAARFQFELYPSRELTIGFRARVRHLDDRLTLRIERLMFGPVVEGETVDIVHEGLGRHLFGEQQGMIVKLDVIIGEALRYVAFAHDRHAVYQGARLHRRASSTRTA